MDVLVSTLATKLGYAVGSNDFAIIITHGDEADSTWAQQQKQQHEGETTKKSIFVNETNTKSLQVR